MDKSCKAVIVPLDGETMRDAERLVRGIGYEANVKPRIESRRCLEV
jgi:hypothetical protein